VVIYRVGEHDQSTFYAWIGRTQYTLIKIDGKKKTAYHQLIWLYHSRPSAGGKGEGERLAGSHQDQ
jgi:hypothetical protein